MRLLKAGLVAVLLSLSLAAPAIAGPIEDATAAYQRGDYATALRLWRPLAEHGNARAQGFLGFMYANGDGVPQNYAEAVKWYRKAADQGNADAQTRLGLMYQNGQGVPQDYASTIKWLRKAADQGYGVALLFLGQMYMTAMGCRRTTCKLICG
jgi:TPR repeat protein